MLLLVVAGAQEAAEILEKRMAAELMAMPLQDALPITRACGHYLNLTGIAEIHHRCYARSRQWVLDGTHAAHHDALQCAQQCPVAFWRVTRTAGS